MFASRIPLTRSHRSYLYGPRLLLREKKTLLLPPCIRSLLYPSPHCVNKTFVLMRICFYSVVLASHTAKTERTVHYYSSQPFHKLKTSISSDVDSLHISALLTTLFFVQGEGQHTKLDRLNTKEWTLGNQK